MSVKGELDWVEIENVKNSPWKAICRLEIVGNNGTPLLGSGCLIGSNKILTAAHNAHDVRYGGEAQSIKVYCGYAKGGLFTNIASATHLKYHPNWVAGRLPIKYDYSILTIDKNLGSQVGYFGYAKVPLKARLARYPIYISGYPNYAGLGGEQLVYDDGRISVISETQLSYSLDTHEGMSGGPVFIRAKNGKYYVVGIHSRAPGSYNEARRIDTEVFNDLKNWI